MIKKLLSIAFVLSHTVLFSQSFSGMYHFTGVQSGSSSTGTLDPTPPPTANGLTFGSFSAVGFTSAPQAGGVFAFKDWGIGATNGDDINFIGSLDPTRYYEVTLTPAANSTITFNSITFNISRSSTGPRHWAVRSSLDSYSVNLPASISPSNSNLSLQFGDQFFWALDSYTVPSGKQEKGSTINLGSAFGNVSNSVSFRFYAYNSESNNGTYRIDTVIFSGLNQLITGLNTISYDLNSHFTLYPNPSNDGIVFIEMKNGPLSSVDVFDLFGKLVLHEETQISSEKIKLNLGVLPTGTYYLKSISEDKIYSGKLIILK